jgi:hypothetical protein
LPPRHAKEEPQTLWRGWVVYYLVAVAQLSGHDAVIAARGESGKESSPAYSQQRRARRYCYRAAAYNDEATN